MTAPLKQRLSEYASQNRISFAMPAHKGRCGAFSPLDVTELKATADLHAESEAAAEANRLLSSLYKSDRSFILSSGSTTAIHAMIASVLRPGDTLLAASDCHMSVINICAVMGIKIRIAAARFDDRFLISKGISSVLGYLNRYPDIGAVMITSPNYYGICSDTEKIAKECRTHGKPLLVDEAHGAHFIASDKLPKSSAHFADLVCQSAHKTLNALTGAAYLHCNGGIVSCDRVRSFINVFETSSPSYPIAASADTARDELSLSGGKDWNSLIDLCGDFKNKIGNTGVSVLENDDATRIVLNFSEFNITGFSVLDILSDKYGIDAEMADFKNVVLITSPKNTDADFFALYNAISEITKSCERQTEKITADFSVSHTGIIDAQKAMFSDGELTDIKDCKNRISRSTVTAYPPGTPIIIAGEKISGKQIEQILSLKSMGAHITGLCNDMIDTVKI